MSDRYRMDVDVVHHAMSGSGGEAVVAPRLDLNGEWVKYEPPAPTTLPHLEKGADSMIVIRQSPTADTRTCDFANVGKETLYASSQQHIADVQAALEFFAKRLDDAAGIHDHDKLSDIDGFHADFLTGFKQTGWWDRHRGLNRHHLTQADGIPADVNLIDVLDFIADCVMAGMARSGSVYPLRLPAELMETAFQNTVALLKSQVRVESATPHHAVARASEPPQAAVATNRSSSLLPGIDTDVQERLIAEIEDHLKHIGDMTTCPYEGVVVCGKFNYEGCAFHVAEMALQALQSLVVPARTGEAGRKTKEGRDGES